jgi:hypothetical protein
MAAAIPLGASLEAFVFEHERCVKLDSAVETEFVWMICTCGARIVRRIDD